MTTLPFLIDDKPVDWKEIISTARDLGYVNEDRYYSTSQCAAYLRSLGHTVKNNLEKK